MAVFSLSEPITITKAQRRLLRGELKRTSLTAITFIRSISDVPEGLQSSHINRWMSGIASQAEAAHLGFVIGELARLPDSVGQMAANGEIKPKRGRRFIEGERRIELTAEMSQHLRDELARTAIDHIALLDHVSAPPEGINARIIRGWLYRDTKTVNEAYWQFVIAHLQSEPDFRKPLPPLRRVQRVHRVSTTK